MGALSLPLLAPVINPVRAAAITLPLLNAQDVVGVWAFRRNVDWRLIGWMPPGAVLGIALGYSFAASMSPRGVMAALGDLDRVRPVPAPAGAPASFSREARWPEWRGVLFGVDFGFTSRMAQIAVGIRAGARVEPQRLPQTDIAPRLCRTGVAVDGKQDVIGVTPEHCGMSVTSCRRAGVNDALATVASSRFSTASCVWRRAMRLSETKPR